MKTRTIAISAMLAPALLLGVASPADATGGASRSCSRDPWYTAPKTVSVSYTPAGIDPATVELQADTSERIEIPSLDMIPHLRVRLLVGGVRLHTWRVTGTTHSGAHFLTTIYPMPAHFAVKAKGWWTADPSTHVGPVRCTATVAR